MEIDIARFLGIGRNAFARNLAISIMIEECYTR